MSFRTFREHHPTWARSTWPHLMLFGPWLMLLLLRALPCYGETHEETVTSGNLEYQVDVGGTMDEFNTHQHGAPGEGGYVCSYQPNVFFEIANVGSINVVNPHVVINGRRNWYTQAGIAAEVFAGGGTSEEKTFKLWNWCRMNLWGGVTYGPPLWGDTRSVVLFMNSFGTGACGTYHRVMPLIGVWGGLDCYGGCQASCSHATQKERYDGAFRYFDCMLRSGDSYQPQGYFCLGLDNQNVVGTGKLAHDHYLSDRVGTVPGFYWMTSLFGGPGEHYGPESNWIDPHPMDITLRPGEALQHTWDLTRDLWIGHPGEPGTNANGQVHYEPVLTPGGVSQSADQTSNLAYTTVSGNPGVTVAGDRTTAVLTYRMNCPYALVGGKTGLRIDIPEGCPQGCVNVAIRFEGSDWRTVWTSAGPGQYEESPDFSDHPEFRDPILTHTFLIRLEMASGEGVRPTVSGWWIDAVFQSYVPSLPALGVGTNPVQYTDSSSARTVRITHEWSPSEPVPAPAPPSAPVFPSNGGTAGFNSTFLWEPASADPAYPVDQYELYLSDRADLLRPLLGCYHCVILGATHSLELPVPDAFIDGKTYFWRVRARNTEGLWGDWSEPWSFTARGPGQPRNMVAQVDRIEGTVRLHWELPTAGQPPAAYEVYGDTQHGFTPLRETGKRCSLSCDQWTHFFPTNLITATTELSFDATGRNEAYYRVCAVDAEGNRSVPSSYVSVTSPLLSPHSGPSAYLYKPYKFTLNCVRAGGNYVFSLGNGMILLGADTLHFDLLNSPSWVSIDEETGVVHALPYDVGSSEYTVRVTNGQGGSDERTYPLEVIGTPGAPTPTITPTPTRTPYAGSACLGTGSDGPIDIGEDMEWSAPRAQVLSLSGMDLALGEVQGSGTFAPADEILIIQMAHQEEERVGTYEFAFVASSIDSALRVTSPLTKSFSTSGGDLVQVIQILHFTTVRVRSGSTVTAPKWDGSTGGVLSFRATGGVRVEGTLSADAAGYRGAGGGQGEGFAGPPGTASASPNGNGGGQGQPNGYCSGGGGGHATPGGPGTCESGGTAGSGGLAAGVADLSRLTFGGGGGTGSGPQFNCCCSGRGGGIIAIAAGTIEVTGNIRSNGGAAAGPGGCGGPGPDLNAGGCGGGGGGSIALETHSETILGYSQITATGAGGGKGVNAGPPGGGGAAGRIAVGCEGPVSGSTRPAYAELDSLCAPEPVPTPTPGEPFGLSVH